IRRRMRAASTAATDLVSSYSRAARFERLRRKWLLPWRVRRSLPDPLTWNRRAVALCVFTLGIHHLRRGIVAHGPLAGHGPNRGSENKHCVAKAEEPVLCFYGGGVRMEHLLPPGKGGDEEQEGAAWEVEIREHCVDDPVVMPWCDVEIHGALERLKRSAAAGVLQSAHRGGPNCENAVPSGLRGADRCHSCIVQLGPFGVDLVVSDVLMHHWPKCVDPNMEKHRGPLNPSDTQLLD